MTDSATPQRVYTHPQPVAPYRHTAVLVALFLLLTVGGAVFQGRGRETAAPPAHAGVVPLYLSLLVLALKHHDGGVPGDFADIIVCTGHVAIILGKLT